MKSQDKEAFAKVGDKSTKAQLKMLRKAEKLYLDAARKAGDMRLLEYILSRSPELEEEVDYDEEIRYNRKKFSFQHNNFPGEKETGSEAHRLAIWWASKDTILAGDQTLISMNDRWYLVEKFDNAENGYQVEDRITNQEYDKINEEIKKYGRSGNIESIQRSTYEIDKLNKRGNTIGGKKSSPISDETKHRGKDNSIQRVGEEKPQNGQTSSNRGGDSKSGSSNKQGVRFALLYNDAIDQLDNGTLDTEKNTHLRVLEHTPQIYIDKADASDREIVMSWDIAYLATKKSGDISGNYHGLGTEIMKALPRALEDPLYIVKQKNGRIAAVTKIVVKGKRSVFASIELEAYQTTIQNGETEAKKYNLVVTVTDAKPNYLQNTIFSGAIVYNKNSEDPAHFILRLKSLEKAVPAYDLAESSDNSISEKSENVNHSTEKNVADTTETFKNADIKLQQPIPIFATPFLIARAEFRL